MLLIRTSTISPFSAENFLRNVSLILGFQETGEVEDDQDEIGEER